MKVSHEVPLCLLEKSLEFNNYQYALPHLLDQNKEYRDFFLKAKKDGVYIIMDNSLHELGEAYTQERLLYWLDELHPNEFFVPDVWEDMNASIENAKAWKELELPKDILLSAVIQAKNIDEAKNCYQEYKRLGYEKIAFSYGNSYYNGISNCEGALGKALGRRDTIAHMVDTEIIKTRDRIHLLGCALPQEFGWYHFPIESIDTSNPIMAAIDEWRYDEKGLRLKPTTNMNGCFNIQPWAIDMELLEYNTKMFKTINRL